MREPDLKPIWGGGGKPAIPTDYKSQHKYTLHMKTPALCACNSPAGSLTADLSHLQASGYPHISAEKALGRTAQAWFK